MRRGILTSLALVALAGCSSGIPSFLGRDGASTGSYQIGGEDLPEGALDPVDVPLTTATAERALHGVIVRADAITPTQGFYGAQINPVDADMKPDESGILALRLTALAPTTPQGTGPARTRTLTMAMFIPNLALRDVKAFRVTGTPNSLTLPVPK